MRHIILSAAILVTATAGFAAMASAPNTTSLAAPGSSRLPSLKGKETYTRIAQDASGACWVKSMGQTSCSLGYESTCETANSVFITRRFIAGGNCAAEENPWG